MGNKTFKTLMITGTVILLVILLFTYCRKEKPNNWSENRNSGTSILPNTANARLINTYSGITYDSQSGMLEFSSQEVFDETINKLTEEQNNYQKDNGYTHQLLNAISSIDNPNILCDSLVHNSPVSDSVLVEFIKKDIPPGQFKTVMFANPDLTEKTAFAYQQKGLPEGIKNQIDYLIKNHSPFVPGLSEFEKLFPDFISDRKIISDAEYTFLMSGGDPESNSNPKYSSKLNLVEATLFNQYLEVKVGGQIIKLLPAKEKNVLIKNGSLDILNYIRRNGDIPRYAPPISEPENGIPISQAPPIVDPNIEVQPTNRYNNGCGEILIETFPNGAGRVTYSANIVGDNLTYYWNFGDGFVSYQKTPTHRYVGNEPSFTTTLTIYNSLGSPCGGFSSGGSGTGTGPGGPGTTACSAGNMYASVVTGFNSTINIYYNFTGYIASTPVTYIINFGDGNSASGSFFGNPAWQTLTHSYPYNIYQTYNITLTLYYPTNGCVLTFPPAQITFVNPTPPSGNCCDKRDREKETWISPDGSHKFNHKLKLSNIIGFGGKFSADVNTYTMTWLGWLPAWSSGCVDLVGNYWAPCTTSGDACSGSSIYMNQGPNCGGAPNHGASWNAGACYYYITTNGVWSTGTAYGGTSFIQIGTCP